MAYSLASWRREILEVHPGTEPVKKAALILACLSLACILTNCNLAYQEISGNICTTLHPVKPISKDIQVTDVCHGESFRFPSNYCTEVNCHGTDLKGGNSGAPSCYKCHGDKWTLFSTTHTLKLGGYYHDSLVNQGNFGDCAGTTCHGIGTPPPGVPGYGYSCLLCHNPVPAPGHRISYGGHRHHYSVTTASVYSDLYQALYCGADSCHGSSLTGGTIGTRPGPSCFPCHSCNPLLPAPGHTLNYDDHRHHYKTESEPESFCNQAGCHGDRPDAPDCDVCH